MTDSIYQTALEAALLFQSLRDEQQERRQLQRLQDELLEADEPDHINLTKLLEKNEHDRPEKN